MKEKIKKRLICLEIFFLAYGVLSGAMFNLAVYSGSNNLIEFTRAGTASGGILFAGVLLGFFGGSVFLIINLSSGIKKYVVYRVCSIFLIVLLVVNFARFV